PNGVLMDEAILPSQRKNRLLRGLILGALLVGAGGLGLTLLSNRWAPKTKAAAAAATKTVEPEPPKTVETPKAPEPAKPAAPPATSVSAENRAQAAKMVQRAQGMILLGKRKQAQPLLLEAQKLDPQNELAKTALAQARGESGDGMLAVQSTPKGAKVLVD